MRLLVMAFMQCLIALASKGRLRTVCQRMMAWAIATVAIQCGGLMADDADADDDDDSGTDGDDNADDHSYDFCFKYI